MSMTVVLERGGTVESRHRVHAAVVDAGGRLVTRTGDPELVAFLRSAAKPLQALPLVSDGAAAACGVTTAELAVCCASHSGEEGHLVRVRSLLDRAGVREDALACGPHPPIHEESARRLARRGEAPRAIHNNCSGKHAGMLLLARHHGWKTEGYHREGHPVQRRMLDEVCRWSGVQSSAVATAVDGCGVLCFALPLRRMAWAFARLAADEGPGRAVLEAMASHPFEVAGSGRLCTQLVEATSGRVVAKVGAEGMYCAADRTLGVGIALKVEDGARRACEVALVAFLDDLRALEGDASAAMERWRAPVVPNTRGEAAARLRPEGRPDPV